MLQSKFAKKRNSFQARKYFTDRKHPQEVFRESIRDIGQHPKQIIVYYGKGGIGKSRLLKTLTTDFEENCTSAAGYTFHSCFISLDAYDFANPINILMAIRNSVKGDCGLFDYALLQYCAKAKMTVEEIMSKNDKLSSPIMDVLNEVISISTASACIPKAALSKFISFIKDRSLRAHFRDEIEEIAELNEFEIFERLPYYLGLCLTYAAEKKNFHVIFLDSYESLLARTEHGTPSVEREDWLRELFLATDALRIVIASRDRLRWDKDEPEWSKYLDQHILKNLSDEDSTWFLEQVPITDPEIREAIVQKAGGVPLYLDLCVDLYESSTNSGLEFDINSLQKGKQIIDRYIRHLSDKDKFAVRVLSVLKCFDREFAITLLKAQNLLYNEEEFRFLLERSIILPVEQSRGLWKVDESVRLHIQSTLDHNSRHSILASILDCLDKSPVGDHYQYLSAALNFVCEDTACFDGLEEKFFGAVDTYANMGFWNEIHSVLKSALNDRSSVLHSLAVYAELIRLRRTGQLQKAESLMEQDPPEQERAGVWYYMFRYMKIQIGHLLGRYDESLEGYRALTKEMRLVRTTIPDHIFNTVYMKYADLQFLKGNFGASLDIVEELLGSDRISYGDHIELLRIKGHIYRFQAQYEEALTIYMSALKIAEQHNLRAYMGKLFTNLTETYCVLKPEQALQWFERAKEENCNNDIELGKALAAASAAHTALGDTAQGIELAEQAVSVAEKTGYQSGRAFGLIVLYYAYVQAGKTDDAARTKQLAEEQIGQIGVYEYLLKRLV